MAVGIGQSLVQLLLRGFLRLLVLAAPLFVLFAAFDADRRRVSWLDFTFGRISDETSTMGTPRTGTSVNLEAQPKYVIEHASTPLWLLSLLPGLAFSLAITIVALLLLRMLRETYAGEPFSGPAERRLRRVSAVVAATAILVPTLSAVVGAAVVDRVLPDASNPLDPWAVVYQAVPWLVVSLLILCVAEAFRVGSRLAHDVDGLV